MALRKTNITRGGGKALKEQVQGLKELEKKLKALAADNPVLALGAQTVVKRAACDVRDEMKAQARAAGWASQKITYTPYVKKQWRLGSGKRIITGQQAIDSLFAFGRRTKYSKYRISALAGATKPETMVDWIAGTSFKHTRTPRKVSPGGAVSMAFVTMLEFGTTRMQARPAIRTAVKTARARIIDTVSKGFKELVEKFSK